MKKFKKYKTIFLINWQEALAYREAFIFWVVMLIMPFLLMVFLWTKVYQDIGSIKQFDLRTMISYYFLVLVVSSFTNVSFVAFHLSWQIRMGQFSIFLTQSLSPLAYFFTMSLAKKALGIIVAIPFFAVLYIIFQQYMLLINIENVFPFIISFIFAFIIYFLISFLAGLLALWVEDPESFFWGKEIFLSFLSGAMLPLDLFGNSFNLVSKFLPFSYLISFPANIYLGRIDLLEIYRGFIIEIIWIILLYLLVKITYKRGLKRYSAVGG